jgi:hypothetical protein
MCVETASAAWAGRASGRFSPHAARQTWRTSSTAADEQERVLRSVMTDAKAVADGGIVVVVTNPKCFATASHMSQHRWQVVGERKACT